MTPGGSDLSHARAFVAPFVLCADATLAEATDSQCGLRGVIAGSDPLFPPGEALLKIDDEQVVLSALKPADDGDGMILRLLNPTVENRVVGVEFGFAVISVEAVCLDEVTQVGDVAYDGGAVRVEIGPGALRTVRVRCR